MRRKIAFVSLLPYHTKCWLFVIWLQIFYSWLLVYINNSVYVAFMPSSVKCGLQFLRSRTYWWNQNPFLEVCCCFYLSVLLKAKKSSCRLPAVCKDDDDFFLFVYLFIFLLHIFSAKAKKTCSINIWWFPRLSDGNKWVFSKMYKLKQIKCGSAVS